MTTTSNTKLAKRKELQGQIDKIIAGARRRRPAVTTYAEDAKIESLRAQIARLAPARVPQPQSTRAGRRRRLTLTEASAITAALRRRNEVGRRR